MKQSTPIEKSFGDYTFYIRPFPAMVAANLTGELAAILMPMLAALAPTVGKKLDSKDGSLLDISIEDAAPAFTGAVSGLSGDKLEKLMRQLLIANKNVSFEGPDVTRAKLLTLDDLNEIFCGDDLPDLFLLAFEVIKLNFSGFFRKLSVRSGGVADLAGRMLTLRNTETSTQTASMA